MPRPGRCILIIDPNEERRGRTRFVLETQSQSRTSLHYRTITAPSVYAAAEIGRGCDVDLLLGFAPVDVNYLMDVAAGLGVPWLFVTDEPMGIILERLAVAAARKRGPKKGTLRRQEVA